MNNRSILASYLLSLLYKITNPEQTSQFQLVKDLNSNRVNDFLLNKTKAVTIYNNLLTYRDRNKKFELQGDRLTVTTNKNYNVDLANLPDKKLMYEFAMKKSCDEKTLGNKSVRENFFINLLQSPVIVASEISTKILSKNPNELCDRLKLLLQEKKPRKNNFVIINEEVFATTDKFLQYKSFCLLNNIKFRYLNVSTKWKVWSY